MTIKEVEGKVGITADNIRYYEKEGLIHPKRNASNNYREYSKKDLWVLERIKILRLLDVPVSDIREVLKDAKNMQLIITKQYERIQTRKNHLKEMEDFCRQILEQRISLESLDETVLDLRKPIWKDRLQEVLRKDMTECRIEQKGLNRGVAGMLFYTFLVWGLIGLGFYYRFSGALSSAGIMETNSWEWVMYLYLGIIFISGLMVYMTSNWLLHMLMFQALVFLFIPAVTVWMYSMSNGPLSLRTIGMIAEEETVMEILPPARVYGIIAGGMACAALFVLFIYIVYSFFLNKKEENILSKPKSLAIVTVGYSVVAGVIMWGIMKSMVLSLLVIPVISFYIIARWYMVARGCAEYNRYYLMKSVIQIVNVPAFLIALSGNTSSWRRDGRTFK